MKKAVAYARVSSKKQSDTSLETQFEYIEDFAEKNGFDLVDKFSDKESGSSADRKSFFSMLEKAYNKEFEIIIVFKLDRFFRNAVQDVVKTEKLQSCGVKVISVLEPFDINTPSGFLAWWTQVGVNDFYRRNLIQEVKSKSRKAAQRGFWMGGTPPYGYQLHRYFEGKKKVSIPVINHKEAPAVELIFELYNNQIGLKSIAKELESKGFKTRKGNKWNIGTIRDILYNPIYKGDLAWGKGTKKSPHQINPNTIVVRNAVDSIVSREVWEKANKLQERKAFERGNKRSYILLGLVEDTNGNKLTGTSSSNSRRKYAYYSRNKFIIRADYLENSVINFIEDKLIPNIDPENVAKDFNKLADNAKIEEKKESIAKELMKLDKQLENLIELRMEGGELEMILNKINEIKYKKNFLSEEYENLTNSVPKKITAKDVEENIKYIQENIRLNPQLAVREIIDKVVVYPDKTFVIFEKL